MQLAAILSVASHNAAYFSVVFLSVFSIFLLIPPLSNSIALLSPNYFVVDYNPCSTISEMNAFRSFPAVIYHLKTSIFVRNDGSSTAFRAAQLRSFFNLEGLLTAATKRTLVLGRQIFLPAPVKACSELIVTMVGYSSHPVKKKEVTVSLRDLFPTDV